MKIKLALVNIAFITYLIGLLSTVSIGIKLGAVLVLCASTLLVALYLFQIIQSIKKNNLWTLDNLVYTLALLTIAVIFIHGFSVSIDMPFLGNIHGFGPAFLIAGILLIILFMVASIRVESSLDKGNRRLLFITVISIVACTSVFGLLGISGILPITGKLIYYSWVFLLFFFLVYSIFLLSSTSKKWESENWILVTLCVIMIIFWMVRFNLPNLMPQGLTKSILFFGFIPVIVLPISIFYIKDFSFFSVFVFYFILLDFYFIHADKNFNYLITVGVNECVGYENATNHEINVDPGISLDALLKEPTENELNKILAEWREKDFTPRQIQIDFEEERPNGDSIKVVSHLVNGKKHYGFIRIPKGINTQEAPILLGLMGGGTGIDVLKMGDLYRLSKGKCHGLLDNYITIMPSFRGNILRGEGFCFRSEGYSGDVWAGAAEDATAFLEVVKTIYKKSDTTKVLASGISRGATVALIIGGLTNKLDYIIANSTHTKFLDYSTIQNERVGGSYSRAFYTPKADPDKIRKRIMASSPYYFADQLPDFELHQGTEDQKTTVRHANLMKQRLMEIGKDESTYKIYIYKGKEHGYDDDETVCGSLKRFLLNNP